MNEVSVPLTELIRLFLILFAAGVLLTLPLYSFSWRRFRHSSVFIKILFWCPLFMVFVGLLYLGRPLRLVAMGLILVGAAREVRRQAKPGNKQLVYGYFCLFAIGLMHLALIGGIFPSHFTQLFITLGFATVLADVFAYFGGNYLGHHKLPASLNKEKSWEGVAGQLVGAAAGVLIINRYVAPVSPLWLFVPIGIGTIVGDLSNSFVKRRLGIKEWSRAIPGHGGFIDRLSSLSGSAPFAFYCLLLSGLVRG